MKKIDAMLIDDEISAINTLRGMLQTYFPQINVMAVATSVDEALQKVKQQPPDLVMLDVEMPPFGSGFDFLEKCPDRAFGVIFVTAYPKYAIKAINDAQPWGYLVKPYSVNDLSLALKNAEERIKEKNMAGNSGNDMQGLVLPDARKGNVVIKIKDIIYCQADGATTDIYYNKDDKLTRFTASKTLKDIEDMLATSVFCRCHHSYAVNMTYVSRYERTGRNGIIHLSLGGEVPISVSKMELFEDQFRAFLAVKQ